MTGKEIYKIWAPIKKEWTQWVRPVPFININEKFRIIDVCDYTIPEIKYIDESEKIAIIVDLPDCSSVTEGIALAELGFRPIPVYNGTTEQKGAIATVDNHMVQSALVWGATKLMSIKIEDDANPAFLLDSSRTNRFKMSESVFDNSWDIYPQDIPSAEYFLKKGINKIIIRGLFMQRDLCKILYPFQQKGIKIFFTNGYEIPKEVKIKKPVTKKTD